MAENTKDQDKDVERLRRILDETHQTTSSKPSTKESKALQSIRRRLHQQHNTAETPPPATTDLLQDKTNLQPKVTIHPKEQPTPPKPQQPPSEPKPQPEKPKEKPKKQPRPSPTLHLTVEDLYEIEKIPLQKPEFPEVKPPQPSSKASSSPPQQTENETLPHWEHVSEPSKKEKQEEPEKKSELPKFQPVTEQPSEHKQKESTGEISTWEPITSPFQKEKPLTKKERRQQQKKQKKEHKQKRKQTKRKQKETKKSLKKQKTIKTAPTLSDIDEKQLTFLTSIKGVSISTAYLLYTNGYTSLEKLKTATTKELTKIKEINKKLAKTIITNRDKHIKEETAPSEPTTKKKPNTKVYSHGEYTLYKREIQTTSGKTRIIHFFSKKKPPEGEPVPLPEGYTVKVNKRTGLPYLTKQK